MPEGFFIGLVVGFILGALAHLWFETWWVMKQRRKR
jgi:hypothetical protein